VEILRYASVIFMNELTVHRIASIVAGTRRVPSD